MQRPTSSSRAPDEHCIVNIMPQQQPKHSPRRRMDEIGDQPIYVPRSNIGRREISRFQLSKWVHAVPVIVLLCLFILWWFSYPVNMVIKDGRTIAIHRIEIPLPLNDTRVDLTILALATTPHASVPQKLIVNNETEAHPSMPSTPVAPLVPPPSPAPSTPIPSCPPPTSQGSSMVQAQKRLHRARGKRQRQ